MATTYEMRNQTHLNASLSFTVNIRNWIIVGNYKGSSKRPYKVDSIDGRFYLNGDGEGISIVPDISIQGWWANSTGTKWNERKHWWNWNNTTITFHSLPISIRENIYAGVEEEARKFLLKFHAEYKVMTANRGFKDKPMKNVLEDEEVGAFMPTVSSSLTSVWENMDVSEWSVARKELGLPKPPRKPRKKKALV